MIEKFRKRRPMVLTMVLFTLIGGVIVGIICVNKEVSDFGTAYLFSMGAGTALTIYVLGYTRFAGAFKWLSGLVSEEDWNDERSRYGNPMILVVGAG